MKPNIVCHMTTSLDGRTLPSQWSKSPDGTREQWSAQYGDIHDAFKADGWIVGRTTMAEMSGGTPHPGASHHGAVHSATRPVHRAPGHKAPYAIGIDRAGKVHFNKNAIGGDHVVMLLGKDAPDSHLNELAAGGISYIVCETADFDLGAMTAALGREFGIKTLALEGGGHINGEFFAAGLIDELSLLVAPALDGQQRSPSLVEYPDGLANKVTLSLISCRALDHGSVHLRYKVTKA